MSEMSTTDPSPLRFGAAIDVLPVRAALAKADGWVFGRSWQRGRTLGSRSITISLRLVLRRHCAARIAEGYQGAMGFGPRRAAIEESMLWLR